MYILIAQSVLGIDDLKVAEDSGVIIYIAAGCYLVGGLLILLRNRWLLFLGAVIGQLLNLTALTFTALLAWGPGFLLLLALLILWFRKFRS